MAVYWFIKEERQTPNTRTTETAHISGCTTYGYSNNPARIRLIYYL